MPEMKVRLHYKHFKIDRRASHDFLSQEQSIQQRLPCAVSRNGKTTKSLGKQKRHRQGAPNDLLDV